MQIYLDYSATTPTRPEAIALMQQVLTEQWGNPSSLHAWGNRSATLLERARAQVAQLINAPAETIVFTSGGTEANNLAVMGVARCYSQPQHIIISSVEHSAIGQPVKLLEQWGWQVTRLPVNVAGQVNPADLRAALQPNTVLVSIIYGQSEVGTVQPIAQLGTIAQDHGARFHTDAVQVAGRLPLDVQQLPVDFLSLSSHKLYGPQGAGALYVRPRTKTANLRLPEDGLVPLLIGGGQEENRRSGTPAVATIAGFGLAAAYITAEMPTETPRLIGLRNRLFDRLSAVPGMVLTGVDPTQDATASSPSRLPHHVSFCFPDADGETLNGKVLVRQMNLAGIGISAGAACNSGTLAPSSILQAMGYADRAAKSGIRLTLGQATTVEDVDWAAMVLQQILARLVSRSHLGPSPLAKV